MNSKTLRKVDIDCLHEVKMMSNENDLAIWKFVASMAGKLAGGMVGVGTSIATGNPFVGASIGIPVAHTLERAGSEFIERRLAPRQNVRVGRAIAVACVKLMEHQKQGKVLRKDGFFEAGDDGRSAADEITETALQAAMNSAQERKVDFVGALIANIAVDQKIDVPTAHLLIKMAESISYRSFVLLKIAGKVDSFGFSARPGEDVPGPPPTLHPLMVEAYDLSMRGLIESKDNAETVDAYIVSGSDDIYPAKLRLSTVGQLLHDNLDVVAMEVVPPGLG